MLDLKFVRENFERVTQMLEHRRVDMDLTRFQELDQKRRSILTEVEQLKHRRNVASEHISLAKKEKTDTAEFRFVKIYKYVYCYENILHLCIILKPAGRGGFTPILSNYLE